MPSPVPFLIQNKSSTTGDPSFSSVVLLAGNDNAVNGTGTFLDQSSSHKTLTKTGTPTYSNVQAPAGMTTAIVFNATPDYIAAASSADFQFGTGDFTIEWMQYIGTLGTMVPVDGRNAGGDIAPSFYFLADGTIHYFVSVDQIVSAAGVILAATWQHVALSKISGSSKLFVAGTQAGSTYADGNTYVGPVPFQFGAAVVGGNPVNGRLSNLRVTKGVGRYSANFTPPSLPLPTS
jgi:hypothetical protein